jgi:hypothetical protein
MPATITVGSRGKKAFSWSYSKLKNFEVCPRKHYVVDLAKTYQEEEGESLMWGNAVHAALAARVGKGVALPAGMEPYEPWAARIVTGAGNILVEQKLAITKEFSGCSYFAPGAWFRGIGDVIKINGPVALGADWKTGKILDDSVQLALLAQCIFAHYPEVKRVRSEFIWLKEDCSSREDFTRADMAGLWRSLWPRVEQLQHAYETMSYPPKPGRLCRKYCPDISCQHHGKQN